MDGFQRVDPQAERQQWNDRLARHTAPDALRIRFRDADRPEKRVFSQIVPVSKCSTKVLRAERSRKLLAVSCNQRQMIR